MISFSTYDAKTKEIEPLKNLVKNLAASLTDEQWDLAFYDKLEDFLTYVDDAPLIDMTCFDVADLDAQNELLSFREKYQEAQLMLLADPTISPTVYLRPGIRPDSLMLRPFSTEVAKATLSEFIQSYLDKVGNSDSQSIFVIEERDGKTTIPYNDIFYFESKEKKVFARTLNDEYGFYDTLDSLEEKLPEQFARCHRSFIINTDKLEAVYLSQSFLELTQGFEIPLSRSYKSAIKAYK